MLDWVALQSDKTQLAQEIAELDTHVRRLDHPRRRSQRDRTRQTAPPTSRTSTFDKLNSTFNALSSTGMYSAAQLRQLHSDFTKALNVTRMELATVEREKASSTPRRPSGMPSSPPARSTKKRRRSSARCWSASRRICMRTCRPSKFPPSRSLRS
ncbi:MAG: hypothetical protein WDN72_08925 [Alphaproteobacteria bacterium]